MNLRFYEPNRLAESFAPTFAYSQEPVSLHMDTENFQPRTVQNTDQGSPEQIQRIEDHYRALSRISRFRSKETIVRELLKHIADSDRNQLSAEKRKADLLLSNILPGYMIDELKAHGRVPPAHHENAYILFTDFVGFSAISRYMSPGELLRELSIYFEAFEEICERYSLEKVKTIGDSLLCVGGVRSTNRTTHIDSVLAAMEMLRFAQERKKQKEAAGEEAWDMRAIVHSGPLVAGVVGHSKIAFDIWGHTVNVASRIESVASEGVVTISETMYQQVRDFFDCNFKGEYELKGTGKSDLYTVAGVRQEFLPESVGDAATMDGHSAIFNDRFRYLHEALRLGHHVMRKRGRYHLLKQNGTAMPDPIRRQSRQKRLNSK